MTPDIKLNGTSSLLWAGSEKLSLFQCHSRNPIQLWCQEGTLPISLSEALGRVSYQLGAFL